MSLPFNVKNLAAGLTPEQLQQFLSEVSALQSPVANPPPRPLVRQHISPPFRNWDMVHGDVQLFLEKRRNAFSTPIPIPEYNTKSPIPALPAAPKVDTSIRIKSDGCNIPSFMDTPSLLLHHLNEPESHTPVSIEIEQAIDDRHEMVFLLGTAGAGKTRSALEFISRRFAFYLSARVGLRGGPGAVDFEEMVDGMAGKSRSFTNAEMGENAAVVEHWVMALLVARFEVLAEYLRIAGAAATPYQFAMMQLLPEYTLPCDDAHPSDLTGKDPFSQLTAILRHAGVDELYARAQNLLRLFRRHFTDQQLPVVVDEVQVMLDKETEWYAATTDKTQERPLFAPVVRTILSVGGKSNLMPVVVSGTRLSITEAEEKSGSMVAKGMSSTTRVICRSGQSFKAFRQYIEQFVHLTGSTTKEESDAWWLQTYNVLRGRPRFAATFLELCIRVLCRAPAGSGSLGAILSKVRQELLRSDSDKSVYAAVQRLHARRNPTLWNFAVDICASYLYMGTAVVFFQREYLELVELGLAQLQTKGTTRSLEGRIDEPLVARAMFEFCRDKKMDLAHRVFHWMGLSKSNPSTSGFLWEIILPIELSKLFCGDKALKSHPLFSPLHSSLPSYFDYPARIRTYGIEGPNAVKATNNYRLTQYLANPLAPFFLPEFRAGPDIVFAIEFATSPPMTIACFLQAKLAVKVSNKRSAKMTTIPEAFYSAKGKTGSVEERNLVLQQLVDGYNRREGVIRITLAYPAKFSEAKTTISAMPIRRSARARANDVTPPAYPDVHIIIDANNIGSFASEDHVRFLENLKSREFEHRDLELDVGFSEEEGSGEDGEETDDDESTVDMELDV
ncbi:hypothetical protein HK097_001377 [Rhizophlyctis rosea]|uniref:Uncharacterized protein n=1 Tax=Rhizophlyctis rosea TaxID=64517 RepID=A0AAD5S6T5_9FUNG|nr:hypothetical protein HK097_001377 [Rhizophlyctis rosea]